MFYPTPQVLPTLLSSPIDSLNEKNLNPNLVRNFGPNHFYSVPTSLSTQVRILYPHFFCSKPKATCTFTTVCFSLKHFPNFVGWDHKKLWKAMKRFLCSSYFSTWPRKKRSPNFEIGHAHSLVVFFCSQKSRDLSWCTGLPENHKRGWTSVAQILSRHFSSRVISYYAEAETLIDPERHWIWSSLVFFFKLSLKGTGVATQPQQKGLRKPKRICPSTTTWKISNSFEACIAFQSAVILVEDKQVSHDKRNLMIHV